MRYGRPTIQAFWILLRAQRDELPTLAECGSEDDEEPSPAVEQPPERPVENADTVMDEATLCYPTQEEAAAEPAPLCSAGPAMPAQMRDPAQQDTVQETNPPENVAVSQRDLFQRWQQGEVSDQAVIDTQGSGVWHHFLTRRAHLQERRRQQEREHQEWLNRELSSDDSS